MSGTKRFRNVIIGLVVAVSAIVILLAVAAVRLMHAFDTSRSLSDFASPAEALTFTSSHLPAPLPPDAVVETLAYDRWTDWVLDARVRLPTAAAADSYLEQAKRDRKLDDSYCYGEEPAGGARYFLPSMSACGVIRRLSAEVLDVHCNTR